MYEDLMTTGNSGSFVAFALLAILVIGGIWIFKNRNKK